MRIWQLYQYVNFVTRKEKSGRISPEEFNLLLPIVQMKYFKETFGLPERYAPGNPIPNKAWEITSSIKDSLRKFIVSYGTPGKPLLALNAYGQADIPTDYCHYTSFGYNYKTDTVDKWVPIEVLRDADINSRLGDALLMPTKKDPCVVFYDTIMQFYPIDLRYVRFTYLRNPVDPVLGYKTSTEFDDIEEDDYSATDLEFPESDHINIANLLLKEIGIHLKDQLIIQYADQAKAAGI